MVMKTAWTNSSICTSEKSHSNTIACNFFYSIWFYTQSNDGVNTSSKLSPQRNCYSTETQKSRFLHWTETDFFDIVAGVQQRYTLAPYLFITFQDWVIGMSIDLIKESCFTRNKKARSGRYPAETITDPDDGGDITLLGNSFTQAESQQHLPGAGSRRHRPPRERKQKVCQCFNRESDISTLNGVPRKLVEKLTYLHCRVSSTKCDINMWLDKRWTYIGGLSMIEKSDQSKKIKRNSGCANTTVQMHHMNTDKILREKAWKELH